ncbi:MAG TPA: Rieske 2Fe-2S domain-containing protein [Rubricoccaceae bacterium]|nr:Rieske 2Fe-2S domain-containing protein [Rubricoccaceae bacterium]
MSTALDRIPERVPGLAEAGLRLSRAVHDAVLAGGRPVRKAVDALHGTWLGHPLHPVLTDVTVGAWVLGVCYDAVALATGDRFCRRAGDTLAAVGTASALPTAVTGLADYSTVPMPAAGMATLHAAVNTVGLTLYAASLAERRRGRHAAGAALAFAGVAAAGLGAYLGGHLVYRHKVGVDHRPEAPEGDGWKPALAEADLAERTPTRVEVEGYPVLLYRDGERVYAIGSVCAHAGGPLEEGEVEGCDDGRCTVRCPWHDSVFDLRDGRIVHGPSAHPQLAFETRVRDGQVEVRPRG